MLVLGLKLELVSELELKWELVLEFGLVSELASENKETDVMKGGREGDIGKHNHRPWVPSVAKDQDWKEKMNKYKFV